MIKVAIIGMGNVGTQIIRNLILLSNIDLDIGIIDPNISKVFSEIADIEDAMNILNKNININLIDYKELNKYPICILSVGNIIETANNGSRIYEQNISSTLMNDIAIQINNINYNGNIFIITNPNEISSDLFLSYIKINTCSIYGIGTALDTLRLRSIYNDNNINAYGVHGNINQITPEKYNLPVSIKYTNDRVWKILIGKKKSDFAISLLLVKIILAYSNNQEFKIPLYITKIHKNLLCSIQNGGINYEESAAVQRRNGQLYNF